MVSPIHARWFSFFSCTWLLTSGDLAQSEPILQPHVQVTGDHSHEDKASSPTLALEVTVAPNSAGQPQRLEGEAIYSGLGIEPRCFYMPYNDPEFGSNWPALRRYEVQSSKLSNVFFLGGGTEVYRSTPNNRPTTDYLLWVKPDAGRVAFSFRSSPPRRPNSPDQEWFFDGFYPQLLTHCPLPSARSETFQLQPDVDMHVSIKAIPGWDIAAPGVDTPQLVSGTITRTLFGREYAFLLARKLRRTTILHESTEIEVWHQTAAFLELLPTIRNALASHESWFGPLPFRRLVIAETSDLYRPDIPGLISFNVPQQSIFRILQRDWLNWQHWIMTTMLASQWYGGSLTAASPDDLWFTTGMADFATLEALQLETKRINLFQSVENSDPPLTLTYLQLQEIYAALMTRQAPLTILTDDQLASASSFRDQYPQIYVKHALAMRQLRAAAGEPAFKALVKSYTQKRAFALVTPRDFHDSFHELPSPLPQQQREELSGFLKAWWTSPGWPDFALVDWSKVKDENTGKWRVKAYVASRGDFSVPVSVFFRSKGGSEILERPALKIEGSEILISEGQMAAEPDQVVIDANRDVFDIDRFSNSSGFPAVRFLPGNAKTLADDEYTVIWLPYPFRRPGEPFSVAIAGVFFKYLQSGLYVRLESAPSEKLFGYGLRYEGKVGESANRWIVSANQDYRGFRLLEGSLGRSPLIAGGPRLGLALKARHREVQGQKDSGHGTFAIGSDFSPQRKDDHCGLNLNAEAEYTPPELSRSFKYSRYTGLGLLSCRIVAGWDIMFRGFMGAMFDEGPVPDLAFFRPEDAREAHLRLDLSGIGMDRRLAASSTDVFFPLVLPLPGDSLILSRQVKGRLFYDYGYSLDREIHYRASGLGIYLPFGGDFSGAGSLAVTNVSIMTILYSDAGGNTSRVPRLLLDIAGEL